MNGLVFSSGDLIAIGTSLVLTGIAWGNLKTRVDSHEKRLDELAGVREKLAEIFAKLDAQGEFLKDLNASVRWMRRPAPHGEQPD